MNINMPVKKAMTIVQQQSVAKHRMVVDIYGRRHPAGQYNDLKCWLNDLSTEIPAMPEGEVLTLNNNDQILLKEWTVRKDNRLQIRILEKCVLCTGWYQ